MRKPFSIVSKLIAAAAFTAVFTFSLSAGETKTDTAKTAAVKSLKPQTSCPVYGGAINKKMFVDYNGKRIYVCCESCIAEVKKDPEKYIKKLASEGQEVETISAPKHKKSPADSAAVKPDTSMKGMDMKDMKMDSDSGSMKGMDHSKMKM